jgi:hypothetical protein
LSDPYGNLDTDCFSFAPRIYIRVQRVRID